MIRSVLVRFVAATILLSACALVPARAQSVLPASDDAAAPAPAADVAEVIPLDLAGQRATLDTLEAELTSLRRDVTAGNEDEERLLEIRLRLDDISASLTETGEQFRPRLAQIDARLAELGEPPAEGQPEEPATLRQERDSLIGERAKINTLIGEQKRIALATATLVEEVTALRRELFTKRMFKRVDLPQTINISVLSDTVETIAGAWRRTVSWLGFAFNFKLSALLGVVFFSLLAAYFILYAGRRFLGSLRRHGVEHGEPAYWSKLSAAFWSTIVPSLSVAVFLGLTFALMNQFQILTGSMAYLIGALFIVIGLFHFVFQLSTAVLRPGASDWRLFPLTDRSAGLLRGLIVGMAVIVGADILIGVAAEIQAAPLGVSIFSNIIATVLVGVSLIAIAWLRLFEDRRGHPLPWGRALQTTLFVLGLFPIIAGLAGYIGLAIFTSRQILINGAFLVTAIIGFMTASAINEPGAFATSKFGRWLRRRYALSETAVDRLGIVTSVAINILVVVTVFPLMLLQLGFLPADLWNLLTALLSDVRIGSVSISLAGIALGVVVFILGYSLTRLLQGWLDGRVMARGRVETGVRNSVRMGVGYAGVAIAALFAISVAGVNLSNLALIAGALSLGIGFGLQTIVSNFVSGLILLAERPIKVGDWIEAGTVSGTVKRINVRATEIETFQRQTVIMPNSELINAAVGNWMHKNKLGRGEVAVGVAYGSDVKLVKQLLLEIADEHPLVLKHPEPFVAFLDFGASSLDFDIRFYLADVGNRLDVATDIRFAITEKFAEHKIEIPFPQRDLNLTRSSMEALSDVMGKGAAKKAQPAKRTRRTKTTETKDKPAQARRSRRRSSYGELE